jgi:hypothetical protein
MDPDRSGHVEWKEFRDQLTNYRQIKKEIIHAHAAMLEEKEEERLEQEKRRKKAARAKKNKRIKAELAEKTQAMLEKSKEKKRQYDEQEKAKADKRREEEKKATELRDRLNKRYRGKAARRIKDFQKIRDTRVLKSLEELSRRNRGQVGAPEEVARETTSIANTTSAKTSERPSPASASVTQGEIPSLWKAQRDLKGREFYHNPYTKESSWLLPDGNASVLKRDSRLGKDIVIPRHSASPPTGPKSPTRPRFSAGRMFHKVVGTVDASPAAHEALEEAHAAASANGDVVDLFASHPFWIGNQDLADQISGISLRRGMRDRQQRQATRSLVSSDALPEGLTSAETQFTSDKDAVFDYEDDKYYEDEEEYNEDEYYYDDDGYYDDDNDKYYSDGASEDYVGPTEDETESYRDKYSTGSLTPLSMMEGKNDRSTTTPNRQRGPS